MSKTVSSGQARTLIGSFVVDTPWKYLEADVQSFIELPPAKRGERFAEFVRRGCRTYEAATATLEFISEGKTELWLHPEQVRSGVRGLDVLRHLASEGLLAECADLADLEAIRDAGVNFFRRHFDGKAVFGWKSYMQHQELRIGVPYLVEDIDSEEKEVVVLTWCWADQHINRDDPALRFVG